VRRMGKFVGHGVAWHEQRDKSIVEFPRIVEAGS
jgi:hypothetical protein